jgi:ATP adenylyltransferase
LARLTLFFREECEPVNYDQLWAPWRLGYIKGEKTVVEPIPAEKFLPGADPQCFICQAVPQGDDENRLVVHRGKNTLAMLNRYPYNNGHILVAPQRHISCLEKIDDDTHLELMQTLSRMIVILKKTIQPEGFNVGLNLGKVAGAGLPGHLHWHIVPRWSGDTHFMPILAGVRVIPQSLEELWGIITKELAAQ